MNTSQKYDKCQGLNKQTAASNLTADAVSDAIKTSVWPVRGAARWSVKELESILNLKERQAYRKVNGDTDWTTEEVLLLIRESIVAGGSPLLDLLIPEGYEILANVDGGNGFLEDLAEETQEIGDAIGDLKAGNYAKCEQDLDKAQHTLSKLRADVRGAKGAQVQ